MKYNSRTPITANENPNTVSKNYQISLSFYSLINIAYIEGFKVEGGSSHNICTSDFKVLKIELGLNLSRYTRVRYMLYHYY